MEAQQLTVENVQTLAHACGGRPVVEIEPITGERWPAINVPTKTGMERLTLGDFLVKDADDTWVVIDEATFHALYDDKEDD